MGSRLKVGLIGLSPIAAGGVRPGPHPSLGGDMAYSHAGAYARFPECEVTAVCDLSAAQREAFLHTWGATWPEARAYDDAQRMFSEQSLDIVSIATPDHLHRDLVLTACDAGVKAILCEKPLATTLADCDQIIAAVEQAVVKMNVDHTYRWFGAWQDARRAIDAGEIGEVRHVTGFLGGPRAMLFRNGTHLVDSLNYFAGGTPVWVSAELEPGFDHYRRGYAGDGGRAADSEPGANAQIGYDNGVRATYLGMKGCYADFGVQILGAKGRITLDSLHESLAIDTGHGLSGRRLRLSHDRFAGHEYQYPGIAGAVADLLQAIKTGGPTLSPPTEARKAVALLLGMLRSHFAGGLRVALPATDADLTA
ncbi:MAG TPA: Gfo/Idh/MocA family oxidoreductase [Limnochordia bacterium]|nr:Gfo/Idh/MocA family oxidoreductase [Limnochordia bacterium]